MIYIKPVNHDDSEKEWLFVKEMPPDENGLTNEWYQVSREDFEAKALPQMIAFSEGKNLPKGYVPESFLFLNTHILLLTLNLFFSLLLFLQIFSLFLKILCRIYLVFHSFLI